MEPKFEPPTGLHRSIAMLRLNLEEATNGRTWLLLPQGFRHKESGSTYPLPTRRAEIQKLVAIPIPPNRQDSGSIYLRRAIKEWKKRLSRRNEHDKVNLEVERKMASAQYARDNFGVVMKNMRAEARLAAAEVRKEAEKAIASMNDLFSLTRQGLEGQMKAHLAGEKWHDEKISASAFRDCSRIVTQTVKGLGLPSDQREPAVDAVMEEYAASLRATQETVALAPGNDQETQH